MSITDKGIKKSIAKFSVKLVRIIGVNILKFTMNFGSVEVETLLQLCKEHRGIWHSLLEMASKLIQSYLTI
jgi:hypothetical protein